MTGTGLEAKFTQNDVDAAAVWTYRANELLHGHHEFDPLWVLQVLEGLHPYQRDGNVVQMCFQAVQRLYKERTGKDYRVVEVFTPERRAPGPAEGGVDVETVY